MKFLTVILVFYSIAFSFLAIRNHELYQTFGWDLGFFDQLLWQASRGNLNFVSTIGNINILGDHFQPIIYLLVLLYWLFDNVRVILIAQVLLVTAAVVPLFLLAKQKTKSESVGLAVSAAYLLFSGTQFTITNEFHQSAFIPLLMSWGLYWLETGRERRGILTLSSLLLVKEESALLLTGLGLMYLCFKRVKLGIFLVGAGVVSFFILINWLIPTLSSQNRYIHFGYGSLGETPQDVIGSVGNNPAEVLKRLVYPQVKIEQVVWSLASYGGLPILSPVSLIPVIEQYAIRFLDDRNIHRWINNNHYSAPLGPLLAFGTIMVFGRFRTFLGRFGTFYLIAASIAAAIALKTPIFSIFKPQLYFTPEWVKDADKLVEAVPAGVGLAVNNSLAPHLAHRDKIYLLPEIRDAEYIAVDLADGPNKHAPWPETKMREYIGELVDNGGWEVKQRFGEAILLGRISK